MIRHSTATISMSLALMLAIPACNKDKTDGASKANQADKANTTGQASAKASAPDSPPVPVAKATAAATAAAGLVKRQVVAKPTTATTGCAKLFATTSTTLTTDRISCIEGAMESKDYEFDSKACNGLENAWPVGIGDFKVLWAGCQAEQKFDDAACNAVLAKCF